LAFIDSSYFFGMMRLTFRPKKVCIKPGVVHGLLVDRTGFPLEVGCFEGNTTETNTLLPIITAFQARHDLTDTPMVIAADAGMLSASNLSALDEAGLGFIVGSRSVKAPIDLASHFQER
jgi:transposase